MPKDTDILTAELKKLRTRLAQCERAITRHKKAELAAQAKVAALHKQLAEQRRARTKGESAPSGSATKEWGAQEVWAHELKQPLTAVLNYTLAGIRLLEDEGQTWTDRNQRAEVLQALRNAVHQAERAADLVRDLRRLAVPGELRRISVQVHDLIGEALRLLEGEMRAAHVRVEVQLADSPQPVQADPLQIRLVLLNLLRNAIEAVETSPAEKRVIRIKTQMRAAEMEAAISDSGKGLSLATVDKLFRTYQSTKPEGMGLGLAMSRAIVQAHGGRLWAKSHGARGTTFLFTLPIGTP